MDEKQESTVFGKNNIFWDPLSNTFILVLI
jgi:hypothetical protein